MRFLAVLLTTTMLLGPLASAAEQRVRSPDGKLTLVVFDDAGLCYRVELDGKPLLADSVLGLAFADGTTLGPSAKITTTQTAARNTTWDNPLGQRRTVPDRFRELRINLSEGRSPARTFGLIVRAYDDGVAIRYDLPEASKLGHFVLTNELTEFRFAGDYRCWFGEESSCAENRYPEAKLSTIPPGKQNTLPLLVETPAAYVAVAEADLLDWAGMFTTGTASNRIGVKLASRSDGNGLVISDELGGNQCTVQHTITLPFTRGLLGPMDFTPGGFLNRTQTTFKMTYPAQVMGTRARQLAMTVVYQSPLLVLCDSPANYRGQPGVEFFRDLPTVWDESVVLSAEVGKHIVIARRSGRRWFIAAMNGDDALTLDVPLGFLDAKSDWQLREFADGADPAAPETVVESTRDLGKSRTFTLRLAPGGGYAATLSAK